MRTVRAFATAMCVGVATATAVAHDFWLSSSQWSAAPGARVTVLANVGDRFPTPTSLTSPDRVASFRLLGPAGSRPVTAFRQQGHSLAADVMLSPRAGTYLALMVIKPRPIEIGPADFRAYLTHEGLEGVIREREARGEADTPGREIYSRYAKLLIRAGDGPSEHAIAPLGLPAELVPAVDPTGLRPGASLDVRLLSYGEPVPGALIGAVNAGSVGEPDEWPVRARTDAQGRAALLLGAPGPWLVRSVHMTRSRDTKAEWVSYWASLAFDFAR